MHYSTYSSSLYYSISLSLSEEEEEYKRRITVSYSEGRLDHLPPS